MNVNEFFKFHCEVVLYHILYVVFVIMFIVLIFCYLYYLKILNII